MRNDHRRMVGLSGVILLGALAVGATGPNDPQEPVLSAFLDVPQLQAIPFETVDPTTPNGLVAPPGKVALQCSGILVGATELVFSDGFETGDPGNWGPDAPARFSSIRMLDLNLSVRFADGFTGDHLLHLKLFTPKGHHYQTLSVAIASDPKRSKSLRRIEGYPRPVAVRPLHKVGLPSLPKVTVSVPVGGTPIVTNSLFGMWTVEAYLDDRGEVCASQVFVLDP